MSNIQERLINCYNTVFPDLSRDEILRADAASVAAWDSLATVTLIAVIEEEFGVEIAPENFEYLTSFELTNQFLINQTDGKLSQSGNI
jgi:acyl carrier protein